MNVQIGIILSGLASMLILLVLVLVSTRNIDLILSIPAALCELFQVPSGSFNRWLATLMVIGVILIMIGSLMTLIKKVLAGFYE